MIPVHQPAIYDRDIELVIDALREGAISGSSGQYLQQFEQMFAEFVGVRHAIAVSSGSTALHLACVLGGVSRGHEVMMNACTNIATACAVVQQGGIVVPIDSEEDTWNMNPSMLEYEITKETKAIIPVHIYGHPVDMTPVMKIAKRHNLFVIEDCAEALGAEYEGRKVGSIGHIGCFSFYANKVVTTGEGGMLTTNDDNLAQRARSLRNLAFGEPRFEHHDVGYNYRLTNLQAALGVAQMERIHDTLEIKRHIADQYTFHLKGVDGLRLPVEREYAKNIYWMYGLVVEPEFEVSRDDFVAELKRYGVDTRTMFCPMNRQPALLQRGQVRPTICPQADELWERGLYLPSGCTLSDRDIEAICHVIQEMSCAGEYYS